MKTNQEQGFVMTTAFEQQMDELRRDMREMRSAVTDMAKAISRLAVLEERNLVVGHAIEKIAGRQDEVEDKVQNMELKQVRFEATVEGVTKTAKAVWAVAGGGVLFIGWQAIKFFSGAA